MTPTKTCTGRNIDKLEAAEPPPEKPFGSHRFHRVTVTGDFGMVRSDHRELPRALEEVAKWRAEFPTGKITIEDAS